MEREIFRFNPYNFCINYNLAANGRTVLTLDTQDIRAYNNLMYPLMMKEKAKECGTLGSVIVSYCSEGDEPNSLHTEAFSSPHFQL